MVLLKVEMDGEEYTDKTHLTSWGGEKEESELIFENESFFRKHGITWFGIYAGMVLIGILMASPLFSKIITYGRVMEIPIDPITFGVGATGTLTSLLGLSWLITGLVRTNLGEVAVLYSNFDPFHPKGFVIGLGWKGPHQSKKIAPLEERNDLVFDGVLIHPRRLEEMYRVEIFAGWRNLYSSTEELRITRTFDVGYNLGLIHAEVMKLALDDKIDGVEKFIAKLNYHFPRIVEKRILVNYINVNIKNIEEIKGPRQIKWYVDNIADPRIRDELLALAGVEASGGQVNIQYVGGGDQKPFLVGRLPEPTS